MGQRKIGMSVRIEIEDRASLQAHANRERRTFRKHREIDRAQDSNSEEGEWKLSSSVNSGAEGAQVM